MPMVYKNIYMAFGNEIPNVSLSYYNDDVRSITIDNSILYAIPKQLSNDIHISKQHK